MIETQSYICTRERPRSSKVDLETGFTVRAYRREEIGAIFLAQRNARFIKLFQRLPSSLPPFPTPALAPIPLSRNLLWRRPTRIQLIREFVLPPPPFLRASTSLASDA